jgi:hypothetical protein
MIRVELLHIPECPNTATARRLLAGCLAELGLTVGIEDREGPFPSPTIRVNGEDVMGTPLSAEASCRLDLPTRERILDVMQRATA